MICVFIIAKSLIADSKASDEVKKVYNIIRETSDEESGFTQESFRAILAENKDFIGYIAWDSGIIEQPILQAADNDYVFAVAVWMPEETDNNANHNGTDKPSIKLGVNLVATQYTYEEDTFDENYDTNAQYPTAP